MKKMILVLAMWGCLPAGSGAKPVFTLDLKGVPVGPLSAADAYGLSASSILDMDGATVLPPGAWDANFHDKSLLDTVKSGKNNQMRAISAKFATTARSTSLLVIDGLFPSDGVPLRFEVASNTSLISFEADGGTLYTTTTGKRVPFAHYSTGISKPHGLLISFDYGAKPSPRYRITFFQTIKTGKAKDTPPMMATGWLLLPNAKFVDYKNSMALIVRPLAGYKPTGSGDAAYLFEHIVMTCATPTSATC